MTVKTNNEMDRSFLSASIPELVRQLTMEEKVSLLAGADFWKTVPVPRLNIPEIKVTDGPNGARGESFFNMTPASALPNATNLGATFSTALAESCGVLLSKETKARNAVCLLAPTINIQRSPLGGRAFESFSEDPTLSGTLAAAYVNGLQDNGISATIKHFVCNDQEHERMGVDSRVGDRALREIYLRPFQIAHRLAKPWAYMTSYNKLNGTHCSENKWLLQDLLRGEWKHDGLVMSDWFGVYSVQEAINAGLDLEMPGKSEWRTTSLVNRSVAAHKIDPRTIDKRVSTVLTWAQKLTKLNEELVYAPPSAEKTRYSEKDQDAKLLRQVATEGIVVLKNDHEVLPIKSKKVLVTGPNAKVKVITGGGSAALRPSWSQTPWEALVDNKPAGVELSYAIGCLGAKFLPTLGEDFTALDGSPGFNVAHYPIVDGKQGSKAAISDIMDVSDLMMFDFTHPDLGTDYYTEIKAIFTAPITGEYEFGSTVTGQGMLWVDDKVVIDNTSGQTRCGNYFGNGSEERKGTLPVVKGQKYQVRYLLDTRAPPDLPKANDSPLVCNAGRLGAFPVIDPDQEIENAVALAKESDVALIIAGLNADWESEGYDRPDLSLPLRSDELIKRVSAVNPNTIVVVQCGSAIVMPWIEQVAGVVYAWYGGNEAGNAIADIVYGHVNPSGRLPLSFPKSQSDIAANLNFKSARNQSHYEEGIWVGYRHHNARAIAPLFPFGHGLSYASFDYSDLSIKSSPKAGASASEWKLEVAVTVTNSGKVAGSHSVHFYTCPPTETATSLVHPAQALQAFTKIQDLKPGEKKTVSVTLDKYAISHWDEGYNTWRVELGEWQVKVGIDAQTMWGGEKFVIADELEWSGL
ncbi:beta-glucosidase, partial [Tremellales sp. Uapishka_1]